MGYKEKTEQINIQGTVKSWVRAKLITCDNTYSKRPSMTFMEEDVTIDVDGKDQHKGHSVMRVDYDPSVVLPFINPETEVAFTQEQKDGICALIQSGNVSHGIVFGMLYSVYMYSAQERDKRIKL